MADNLRVNWSHSPSKARFSWEQTRPLRAQSVYVSASYADVFANCRDSGLITTNCIVKNNNVAVDKEEYLIDRALFEGGRPYYFKVAGAAVPACRGDETTESMYSCDFSQTAPFTLEIGESRSLTVGIRNRQSGVYIQKVNFSAAPAGVVNLNPASDNAWEYETTVTGDAPGQAVVAAEAISGNLVKPNQVLCRSEVQVTVGSNSRLQRYFTKLPFL